MLPAQLGDWTPALLGALSAFADAVLGVGVLVPGEVVVTGLAVTVRGVELAPSSCWSPRGRASVTT